MYSRSAARVIFNSSATSRKYFKWRKFNQSPPFNFKDMKEFLHFLIGIPLLYHSQKAVATITKNLLFGMMILWFNIDKR